MVLIIVTIRVVAGGLVVTGSRVVAIVGAHVVVGEALAIVVVARSANIGPLVGASTIRSALGWARGVSRCSRRRKPHCSRWARGVSRSRSSCSRYSFCCSSASYWIGSTSPSLPPSQRCLPLAMRSEEVSLDWSIATTSAKEWERGGQSGMSKRERVRAPKRHTLVAEAGNPKEGSRHPTGIHK